MRPRAGCGRARTGLTQGQQINFPAGLPGRSCRLQPAGGPAQDETASASAAKSAAGVIGGCPDRRISVLGVKQAYRADSDNPLRQCPSSPRTAVRADNPYDDADPALDELQILVRRKDWSDPCGQGVSTGKVICSIWHQGRIQQHFEETTLKSSRKPHYASAGARDAPGPQLTAGTFRGLFRSGQSSPPQRRTLAGPILSVDLGSGMVLWQETRRRIAAVRRGKTPSAAFDHCQTPAHQPKVGLAGHFASVKDRQPISRLTSQLRLIK